VATIGHVADVLTTTVWEKAAALAAAPLLLAEALRFAEEAIDLREDVVRSVRWVVGLRHYEILCNLHSARPPDGAEWQSGFSNRRATCAIDNFETTRMAEWGSAPLSLATRPVGRLRDRRRLRDRKRAVALDPKRRVAEYRLVQRQDKRR
jgi:hypothetical protein